MTAKPSPIIEKVARAIKLAMKNGKASDASMCDHSHFFMDSWFDKAAQAALDACHAEEMRKLLRRVLEGNGYVDGTLYDDIAALLASIDKPTEQPV